MPTQTKIITVAVPTPLRRTFDYLYDSESQQSLPVIGGRVLIPFANRELVGYVVCFPEQTSFELNKLKKIIKVIDQTPLLNNELFKIIRWSSQYYQYPLGEVFTCCLPSLLNKGEPAELTESFVWRLTDVGKQAKIAANAKKQLKIIEFAKSNNMLIRQSQCKEIEVSVSDLNKLVEKKWFIKNKDHLEPYLVHPDMLIKTPSPYQLSKEQHSALAQIYSSFEGFQGFLLHGVTGSGKTEIYLQAIAEKLKQGQQVLVLVPEIGLTPQTTQRFEQRFNCPVDMLHSGLTDKQRLNIWLKAKQGLTSVIIGTRSALFTPFENLGLIVIDEEHDLSYKQQEGFRYSAKDLALFRAQNLQIPIILGSATPSMESLNNSIDNKLHLIQLRKRTGNAKPPHIKIFDVRQRPLRQGLSQPLIEQIQLHLDAGNQCLLFLNRRGYAPSILCHDCGWLAECNRCDKNMTYHQAYKRLHCHHCDRQTFMPKKCPACQSDQLLPIGLGTEQVEEVLQKLFPKKVIKRVDRDTTRRKQAMNDLVNSVNNNEIDILVGTQMLAKGHHFPKLTLVGVIDIDGCLFSADFRASERTIQLLTQVAGRAGRGESKGEVVIQTHYPDHPLLINLFTQDYQSLSKHILDERKQTLMPPFSAIALFRADANDLEKPMQFLHDAANLLRQYPELECLGPYPAPMTKRAGKMRAQLLIQAPQRNTIQRILNPAISVIEKMPSSKKVRWSIDVDPQEVF